jgi:alpha-glucosidase
LPGSTLNRLRSFFAWRREMPALRRGELRFLEVAEPVLAFERILDHQRVTCIFNFSAAETSLRLPQSVLGVRCQGHGFGAVENGEGLRLPAYSAYFGLQG